MKKKFTQEELKDYMNIISLIASKDKESSRLGWDLLSYDSFYNQFLKDKNSFLLGYKVDKIVRFIQSKFLSVSLNSEDRAYRNFLFRSLNPENQFYQDFIVTLQYPFKNFRYTLNNQSLLQKVIKQLTEDNFLIMFELFKETKFYRKHYRKKYDIQYIYLDKQLIKIHNPISLEDINYDLKHSVRYYFDWYKKYYSAFLRILELNLR